MDTSAVGKDGEDGSGMAMAMLCGGIVTVCLAIAYSVTGIVYLVIDRDTCKDGDQDTPLWIFCLVWFISGACISMISQCICPVRNEQQLQIYADSEGGTLTEKMRDQNNLNIKLNSAFQILCYLAFLVTGAFLINGTFEVCDELKSSGLWVWFLVTFVLICISVTVTTVLMVMGLMAAMVADDPAKGEYDPVQEDTDQMNPVTTASSYQATTV